MAPKFSLTSKVNIASALIDLYHQGEPIAFLLSIDAETASVDMRSSVTIIDRYRINFGKVFHSNITK